MTFIPEQIFTNREYIRFLEKIKKFDAKFEFSHSMIGFNFTNDSIVSIKLYFVFYGSGTDVDNFSIVELQSLFRHFYQQRDEYYLTTKMTPGGGITLTLKFDSNLQTTEGFYFRLKQSNQHLIDNIQHIYPKYNFQKSDFESGYGQYVLLKGKEIETKEYLYLKDGTKLIDLENKYGILFSQTKHIELSSANSTDLSSHKFIAIELEKMFTSSFKSKIPAEIVHYATMNKLNFICPAVSISEKIQTIYLIGNFDLRSCSFTNQAIYF